MNEQCFNYADSNIKEMTDWFETRVVNLEPKEEKKKSSAASKKSLKKAKKRKREDSDSSVVESIKECTEARSSSKKIVFYLVKSIILQIFEKIYVQWSTSTSRKEKKFRNHGKSNKELNALIEKKFQKFVKNKKMRKTEKEHQHFQEIQISDD